MPMEKPKPNNKHPYLFFLTLFLIMIFVGVNLNVKTINAQSTSYTWKWSPNVKFKLTAYNTILGFNDYAYFDRFSWIGGANASAIAFYNFEIAGDDAPLTYIGFSVQNANATINYINKGSKAEIVLNAPTGTVSSLTIYYPGNYPPNIQVGSEIISDQKYFRSQSDWKQAKAPAIYLDSTNKMISVKAQHSSPVTITIYWTGISTGGGGVIPTPSPTPSPTPTPITPPTPTITIPTQTLANAGILIIALVVVGAFLYSEYESRQNVAKKWRKKRSQTKSSVTWKKKRRFE